MESELSPSADSVEVPAPPQSRQGQPVSLLDTRLWQPNLIVFLSSACIMVLELVAGRIIAPYVGVSLYTWTSVIGVVLAGISVGNYLGGRLADRWASLRLLGSIYLGGRLADRWASLRLLGSIYLLAGLACFGILAADAASRVTPGNWPILVNILVLTAILFFLPCVILGTISPIVAKLAVRDLAETGSTVGKIYAAGALGSIVGTFATGFVLISWFGTYTIAWGVAAVLLLLGFLFFFGGRWQPVLALVLPMCAGDQLLLHWCWPLAPARPWHSTWAGSEAHVCGRPTTSASRCARKTKTDGRCAC